jgi:hypothetical protein
MSVHTLVDFGPVRPSIQPYKSGYTVPVALTQVERPGIEDGTTETSWQGYLLEVPALTELELDNAIAALPAGDYSADKQAALGQAAPMELRQRMDIRERVVNLLSRLDALEANEVIDDATDTSLLQLLAAASVRLDSLESRVAALESGS